MPRIRTIKPEFPQSESMGNVTRDARLLFILLWTLADDSGRLRGDSRMLASLLFPYDEDSRGEIDGWLTQLEREKCIVRYKGDNGSAYVAILRWLEHQKIDKPSKSRIPEPPSRGFARIREDSPNGRECSSGDQGPRTKDQGSRTKDQINKETSKELKSDFLADDEFRGLFETCIAVSEAKHNWIVGDPTAQIWLQDLGRHPINEAKEMLRYTISYALKKPITNGDHKKKQTTSSGKQLNKYGNELI